MTKVFRYLMAYAFWIVDLALGLWLLLISRTMMLGILSLFYKEGAWTYSRRVDFADKIFVIVMGLAWLILMIVLEVHFRTSALTDELPRRFAMITGSLLLCVSVVDLALFWIQGIGGSNWLRWLILAAELGIGLALTIRAKNRLVFKF